MSSLRCQRVFVESHGSHFPDLPACLGTAHRGKILITSLCEKLNSCTRSIIVLGVNTWHASLVVRTFYERNLTLFPQQKLQQCVKCITYWIIIPYIYIYMGSLFPLGWSHLNGHNPPLKFCGIPWTHLFRWPSSNRHFISFFRWCKTSVWWTLTLWYLYHVFSVFPITSYLGFW